MKTAGTIVLASLLVTRALVAEPIRFASAEATCHSGSEADFAKVIDGVETGPHGWSPAPKVSEPQALVVRSAKPVQAAELGFYLYFQAGRPWNAPAEFSLSFTTDATPSLQGNWQPMNILFFSSDLRTLRMTESGHMRLDFFTMEATGNIPDDTYRVWVKLPGARATGFRLDVFPVQLPGTADMDMGLSWWPPHDFTLTEFLVEERMPETTNIALRQSASASHPLFVRPNGKPQSASNLTDGLPGTFAHPGEATHGADFFFEIDLGRLTDLDHIGLRNRGDLNFERFSRLRARLYDQPPAEGIAPLWDGMARADGSHPAPGEVDILRADAGQGRFRGRYLRLSSDSPVPHSPQLAEVEVYETRTPEVMSVLADGRPLAWDGVLDIPPGVRRLALELRIPRPGLPIGGAFRWRLPGEVDNWQTSRLMTIYLACPHAGTPCVRGPGAAQRQPVGRRRFPPADRGPAILLGNRPVPLGGGSRHRLRGRWTGHRRFTPPERPAIGQDEGGNRPGQRAQPHRPRHPRRPRREPHANRHAVRGDRGRSSTTRSGCGGTWRNFPTAPAP